MARHSLAAGDLFALEEFLHGALFADTEHAWEALDRIGAYLATLTGSIEGEVQDGAWLVGAGIIIAAGAVVEPGAYIHGPCVIGPDTEVRHGAYLRGNVVAGAGCVIGHATEVKNSIFLDGAKAGHFAYIGDSILGNRVNLGAGTKLANLRLDGREVLVDDAGRRRPTGRRKLGVRRRRRRASRGDRARSAERRLIYFDPAQAGSHGRSSPTPGPAR